MRGAGEGATLSSQALLALLQEQKCVQLALG